MRLKRGRGRPRYVPTPADRNTVTSMAACGFKHEDIARCLGTEGIDDKTLRKWFRAELDTAAEKANAAVANKAYQLAVAGNPYQMTMFWLKCRAGWRDVQTFEHSGPDGSAIALDVSAAEILRSRIDDIAERKRAGGSPEPAK